VRDRDLVARWGGEEFVLLFAETGLEGAATIAEKVRASVESLVVLDGDEPVPVTMTFGLAEATAGETIEAVAARADAALYAGKRAGRNQVALADAGEV
jgi:diguanylate cyclase (GGDEF)-like protein